MLLLGCGGAGQGLQAQSKSGPGLPKPAQKADWQKALEILQRNAVKDLLPLSKLLENELLEQKQMAVQAGDKTRSAEMDMRIAVFQERQKPLGSGTLWMPKSQEESWDVFYREAVGKRWALTGTKAVKQFRCEGKDLMLIIADGQEFRHPLTATLMPRAYATRRSSGPGYSVYLVSPDLKQALCLIVNRMYPSASLTPARFISSAPPVTEPVMDGDLLTVLTSSFTQKHREHEQRIVEMLEKELLQGIKQPNGVPMTELLRAVATHRTALEYHAGFKTPPAPALTKEAFADRVKEASWLISGLGKGYRWQFDGQFLRSIDFSGREVEIIPAEVVWPGVVRTTSTGSGSTRYLVVSDDAREAMILPATGVFPGKVVE